MNRPLTEVNKWDLATAFTEDFKSLEFTDVERVKFIARFDEVIFSITKGDFKTFFNELNYTMPEEFTLILKDMIKITSGEKASGFGPFIEIVYSDRFNLDHTSLFRANVVDDINFKDGVYNLIKELEPSSMIKLVGLLNSI